MTSGMVCVKSEASVLGVCKTRIVGRGVLSGSSAVSLSDWFSPTLNDALAPLPNDRPSFSEDRRVTYFFLLPTHKVNTELLGEEVVCDFLLD